MPLLQPGPGGDPQPTEERGAIERSLAFALDEGRPDGAGRAGDREVLVDDRARQAASLHRLGLQDLQAMAPAVDDGRSPGAGARREAVDVMKHAVRRLVEDDPRLLGLDLARISDA